MKQILIAIIATIGVSDSALAQSYCETKGVQTCAASLLFFAVWQPDFFAANARQIRADVGSVQAKVLACLKSVETIDEKTAEEIAGRIPADPSMPSTFQGQQLMTVDSLRRFAVIARQAVTDPPSLDTSPDYKLQVQHLQQIREMLHNAETKDTAPKLVNQMGAYERAYLNNATQAICKP